MSLLPTFKVVLLGEGRVGKTSLVVRYVQNSFNETQPATIQASFLNKRITVDGKTINLAIWDTAGQERFDALGPIYYRDADAALLVFDITDVDSFQRVKKWVRELKKMADKDLVVVVAGNKVDRERERQVGAEEAEAYAASIQAPLLHTSAKINKGVDQAFLHIARQINSRKGGGPGDSSGGNFPKQASRRGGNIQVVEGRPPVKNSECC
mmetsp:Transcript_7434/g.10062  ORF Transcript_7434/g.10062 Transcript_7434/m.10062 type:complete len:210 (+) Transcript_7434:105-734(+)|eukprot:CAMPEP_0196586836 /NCGR_PEP_ID=MMETSP1081-20130531/55753_1 /TAXON_ID=36882 /ORGANISM="Pyramimonas amylifera, Strain CCMP720" /LENGTH=209 /DNA_ID=CAMNT_0041908847 /DNA_START=105 /DNA_END=734 /DNA_ORIENTATION=-